VVVVLMVIAHRCVQQHDSENDMCEYEYYYYYCCLCARKVQSKKL